MYNEQIENLIRLALVDGDLTEKEKQILFKKAELAGIDLDEFEMVLDAKLVEKRNATPPPTAAPKSEKYGDIRKCPACGTILQSFQTKCNDCGHEFTNISANNVISQLSKKLSEIEKELQREAEKDEDYDPKLTFALDMRILEKQASYIDTFPIPNTKEDILEFLSLSVPQASVKLNWYERNVSHTGQYKLIKSWKAKAEQTIMKARFSMKDDKKLLDEIEQYEKQLNIK
jgi:hypothetical protein